LFDIICRVISSQRPSRRGCGAASAREAGGLCRRLQQYIAEDVAVCGVQQPQPDGQTAGTDEAKIASQSD